MGGLWRASCSTVTITPTKPVTAQRGRLRRVLVLYLQACAITVARASADGSCVINMLSLVGTVAVLAVLNPDGVHTP